MKDSENICLACGICCDGSLIGFVQIEQDELSRVREILEIEESDTIGFFLQPCDKFCNHCTIYEDRPRHCGMFECKLLTSVDNNQLEFQKAVEIVKVVKEKRFAIEAQITLTGIHLVSPSFYFSVIELHKILEVKQLQSPLIKSEEDLFSDLIALNNLVSAYFGVKYF